MSTAGISSAGTLNPLYTQTTNAQQRRNLFQQLAQSLQSGNLAQAQQAYTSLVQNQPAGASSNGPIAQDLQTVGQALQSNDLQGAQQAFAKLQTDFQAVRGHHHHHHGGGQNATNQAAGSNTSLSGTDSDGDNDGSGTLLNVSA
ncbi:MAG TPA: hypothetical protein VND92_08300 [Vicinamibacterales bacterium]|nr:hypothetical protein [Vicinamibacterales bacterium]